MYRKINNTDWARKWVFGVICCRSSIPPNAIGTYRAGRHVNKRQNPADIVHKIEIDPKLAAMERICYRQFCVSQAKDTIA